MTGRVVFGIIGAGMIARFHAQAIRLLPHVELAGFYDIRQEAAQKLADEFGCHAYASLAEMLNDKRIQAVTIATPSGLHCDTGLPAAAAGKHILCEKPLDVTPEKVQRMLEVCKKNRVHLVPVFQTRFARPVQLLRQAVQQGRFGRMLFASARIHWYRTADYYSSSPWRGTWEMDGGGALINQAIHNVDLLLYINGLPESVSAYSDTLTHGIEVEDTLCASLRYSNGSMGTIEASTSCKPGFPRRLEFTGSTGSVILEEDQFVRWEFETPQAEDAEILHSLTAAGNNAAGGSAPENISTNGHAFQISDLANAIQNGTAPIVHSSEGANTMQFIFGIYESVRTGKPYQFNFRKESK